MVPSVPGSPVALVQGTPLPMAAGRALPRVQGAAVPQRGNPHGANGRSLIDEFYSAAGGLTTMQRERS